MRHFDAAVWRLFAGPAAQLKAWNHQGVLIRPARVSHGTGAGARLHQERGEASCEPCSLAAEVCDCVAVVA
jgi:hypothetical protein